MAHQFPRKEDHFPPPPPTPTTSTQISLPGRKRFRKEDHEGFDDFLVKRVRELVNLTDASAADKLTDHNVRIESLEKENSRLGLENRELRQEVADLKQKHRDIEMQLQDLKEAISDVLFRFL